MLNEYGESAMDADQWEAASKCLPKKKERNSATCGKRMAHLGIDHRFVYGFCV